ncbi:MAG: hypothetical protein J6T12_05470 [Salinivirgaceae bacterium]|nr:hypothetical protein [Salinivirgaceae bacterium]
MDNTQKKFPESVFDDFIDARFSPSESTVRNIMAYARAHRCKRSQSIGNVEMILN